MRNSRVARLRRKYGSERQDPEDKSVYQRVSEALNRQSEYETGNNEEEVEIPDADMGGAFECPHCGNIAEDSGFYPCLKDGTIVEPLKDGPWEDDLYVCGNCDKVWRNVSREETK